MAVLRIIMLDVGWGDSILIESEDEQGNSYFGLVDSNDTSSNRFTLNFLKRRFKTRGIDYRNNKPLFEFVMLSHAHTDHGQGLKAVIKEFGTRELWYSKSSSWSSLIELLSYARRSNNVGRQQALDDSRSLPGLGNVALDVLWPKYQQAVEADENNNSVVMTLSLGDISFLLSGDAEKEVWREIAADIPGNTRFFKVPHHGSINGSFDGDNPAWLDNCPDAAVLGISCHVGRYDHPHDQVIRLFEDEGREYLRTDKNYHLVFETNGSTINTYYHH